jgi:RNA polymerase sigma factor (sigma-70 family)
VSGPIVSCVRPSTVREWLDSTSLRRIATVIAHRYGLPTQDVPDLVQEICLGLLRRSPHSPANATFVFRTAMHKAIDLLRARSHGMRQADVSSLRPDASDHPELLRLLRARLSLVAPRLRDFYHLRYQEGLTEREIAYRLGLSRGAVRWIDGALLQALGTDRPAWLKITADSASP